MVTSSGEGYTGTQPNSRGPRFRIFPQSVSDGARSVNTGSKFSLNQKLCICNCSLVPDSMTSVCNLAVDDRLRLCSAVFDGLSKKGSLEIDRINYLTSYRPCVPREVRENGQFIAKTTILPCGTTKDPAKHGVATLSPLYVLADSRERGAAFAFLPVGDGLSVEFNVRVIKIGALLYPLKSEAKVNEKGKRKRTSTNQRKVWEEESCTSEDEDGSSEEGKTEDYISVEEDSGDGEYESSENTASDGVFQNEGLNESKVIDESCEENVNKAKSANDDSQDTTFDIHSDDEFSLSTNSKKLRKKQKEKKLTDLYDR